MLKKLGMMMAVFTVLLTQSIPLSANDQAGSRSTKTRMVQKERKTGKSIDAPVTASVIDPLQRKNTVPMAPQAAVPPSTMLDGATLYSRNCAVCHGQGKRRKPVSAIRRAIGSNTGGMGSFRSLTDAQLNSIASF